MLIVACQENVMQGVSYSVMLLGKHLAITMWDAKCTKLSVHECSLLYLVSKAEQQYRNVTVAPMDARWHETRYDMDNAARIMPSHRKLGEGGTGEGTRAIKGDGRSQGLACSATASLYLQHGLLHQAARAAMQQTISDCVLLNAMHRLLRVAVRITAAWHAAGPAAIADAVGPAALRQPLTFLRGRCVNTVCASNSTAPAPPPRTALGGANPATCGRRALDPCLLQRGRAAY
jgi:hypothetical protein